MNQFVRVFFLLLFIAPSANFALRAQQILSDDFSGNSVTSQNTWVGDLTDFVITANHQLQLNAPAAGTSMLAVPYATSDTLLFSAYFQMDFAPSATNLLQFWLSASSSDLSSADGYYLEMGENGGADAIKLNKRISGAVTILASGVAGAVANQPAQGRFSMKLQAPGQWALSADYTGGQTFDFQFNSSDTDLPVTGQKYIGMYCLYTDTRKR